MPVIAKCEDGLLVDVFGKTRKFECDLYALQSNNLVVCYGDTCTIYSLLDMEMINQMKVCNCKELQLSIDGKIVGLLDCKDKLLVCDTSRVILEDEGVRRFGISNTYICCHKKDGFYAYGTGGNLIYSAKIAFISFSVFDGFILAATSKPMKGKQQVLKIDSEGATKLLELDSIVGARFKYDAKTKNALLWLDTSYVNNSYFAESELYFYNSKNLIRVRDCPKIHYVEFIPSGFVVNYGNQPSAVAVLDTNCKVKFKYPRGSRNRVFHASKGELVAFCGFDNMSGDIEIYKSGELVSKFNVLGASMFQWMPCSSYFVVSTTNSFQENNNITMYDYYGRIVKSRKFKSLESSAVYGNDEPFAELEKPNKLFIATYEKYIPPIFGKAEKNTVKKKTAKAEKQRTVEEINADLEKVSLLKNKIKNGENLNMNELNMILSEAKLTKELQNLK